MELLGRYSNQELQVEKLQRILSFPQTGQKRQAPRRPKQKQVRLSPTDVDHLIELYLAGKEINELAGQFDISRTTVMKHVERAGAPRRRGVIVDHLDEARRLYEKGWSLAKVGEHFGVDPNTVWYTFRKLGVARRPRP
ncbi:MAG: hypothetical protein M3Q30_02730 [Actinomycetota bacterium]|nr:hypothetical protein [Actinomycetota bacterium]